MNEYMPSGKNRKLIRNVTAVLVGAFVAYLLLFAIAVRKGNAMYDFDAPQAREFSVLLVL
jgi:preprotein translocase subunit SecG